MKTLLLSVLTFAASVILANAGWEEDHGRLLKKYVTPSGVRYSDWKNNEADTAALNGVVEGIASARVPGNQKEALAFYMNAYNAWILHQALEKYPTKSVKDTLFTFFTSDRIKVAGARMSFNHLEKDIIRKKFNEPRIHLTLNCASRSCPPLRNEPYTAAKLEEQFEDQSRDYANSPRGVSVTKNGVALSKIFDWYKDDFAPVGGSVAFVNKYRSNAIPPNAKVTFQEYDWALNEAK
jgi:hypothetical protein